MPITKRRFVSGSFKEKREHDVKKHSVAVFLKNKSTHAFKANEIAKAVKRNKNTVRGILRKLTKKGLVEHKTPYFIWK